MSMEWDDLKTVLCLVRGGSLAAAAKELGVSYTTVARRIQRAEAAQGDVLFERLADGYRPTALAQTVAQFAAKMEAQDLALQRELAGQDSSLSGKIVLTAPQLLIAHVLGPVFAAFSKAHPDVDIQIRATNDLLDLSRREADMAIRISRDPGDSLTGLRLCAQQNAGFACPSIADQIAEDPSRQVDWLVFHTYRRLSASVMKALPGSRIHMRFDDMVAMQGSAVAGLGVVRMPFFLGRATPGLVQVPLVPVEDYADIWAVAHADVWPNAKLIAFRAILKSHFRKHRQLFVA